MHITHTNSKSTGNLPSHKQMQHFDKSAYPEFSRYRCLVMKSLSLSPGPMPYISDSPAGCTFTTCLLATLLAAGTEAVRRGGGGKGRG